MQKGIESMVDILQQLGGLGSIPVVAIVRKVRGQGA